MTLIECFDRNHGENILGCLRLKPDTLILLGDGEQMELPARRYKAVARSRGLKTRLVLQDLKGKTLWQTVSVLEALLREEDRFVIDLTGGDEQVILAVGAALAGLDRDRRKRVSVQRFEPATGETVDCDGDGYVETGVDTDLTVEELIALHGGTISPRSDQPGKDCSPHQLEGLWQLVAEDPREWNRDIAVLAEFESRSDSKTQVFLPLSYLRRNIADFEQKEARLRYLLGEFDRRGVVSDQSSASALEYTYTSRLMRSCTEKAGNALEIKTLLEARALRQDGKPFFHDCRMGVSIDWDGIVHSPEQRVPETRNEIDLILTRGLTPLFVSCKNGTIGDDELYKLSTVAERFGGPYARKMLIATDLDQKNPASDRSFIQRARDMGIYLVTDGAKLSRKDWQSIFKAALE